MKYLINLCKLNIHSSEENYFIKGVCIPRHFFCVYFCSGRVLAVWWITFTNETPQVKINGFPKRGKKPHL